MLPDIWCGNCDNTWCRGVSRSHWQMLYRVIDLCRVINLPLDLLKQSLTTKIAFFNYIINDFSAAKWLCSRAAASVVSTALMRIRSIFLLQQRHQHIKNSSDHHNRICWRVTITTPHNHSNTVIIKNKLETIHSVTMSTQISIRCVKVRQRGIAKLTSAILLFCRYDDMSHCSCHFILLSVSFCSLWWMATIQCRKQNLRKSVRVVDVAGATSTKQKWQMTPWRTPVAATCQSRHRKAASNRSHQRNQMRWLCH